MDGIRSRISLCYGKRTTTFYDCISGCFVCSIGVARWRKNKVGCADEEKSAVGGETKCQEQVTERIQNNATEFEKSPVNHGQENKTEELFKASTYTEKQDDITSVLPGVLYYPPVSPCLAVTQQTPDQYMEKQDDITSVLSEMVFCPRASPCLAVTQQSPDQYMEKQDDITSVLSEMVFCPRASPCLAVTQQSPDQFSTCNRIEVQEKKAVRFCEYIQIFDAPDYNRRFHKKHRTSIEKATIKMELNKYKSEEMDIHPNSRIYTRYHHVDWRMFRRPDVEYYDDCY